MECTPQRPAKVAAAAAARAALTAETQEKPTAAARKRSQEELSHELAKAPGLHAVFKPEARLQPDSAQKGAAAAPAAAAAPLAAAASPEAQARLLVVQEATEDGCLEFELDGQVYRVKDASAFKAVVAAGPQKTRQPRRTPSSMLRAQRAATAESSCGAGLLASSSGPLAETDAPTATPASRNCDPKLLQAMQMAKGPLPPSNLLADDDLAGVLRVGDLAMGTGEDEVLF